MSFCLLFIECRIVRTRNYWLRRYKAVHFYCQLSTVVLLVCVCVRACVCTLFTLSHNPHPNLLQDLPFLIFACVFMGSVRQLQLAAILALGLALLSIIALGVTCVRER